jgi:hypothetical protein
MKHALIHAVAYAIIYATSLCYAAPPKLNITASKATKAGGTSINVAPDERVTIQISAEAGSTIAIVTDFSYIAPSSKTELTLYATRSGPIVFVAFRAGEVSQQKIGIVVSGDPVPPGPTPVPPGPQPIIPTSRIGKAAYDAAVKVESPTRAADAALIAKGMRAAHAKAVAVATMKGTEILLESIKSFDKLTDVQKKAWQPWGPAMFLLLKSELGDDPPRDKAITAVEEMAKALEAVK